MNLVLVPTRGRPERAFTLVSSFKDMSSISSILLVLDHDDEKLDQYRSIPVPHIVYEPREYLVGKLNRAALQFADKYETITFLADDQVLKTVKWDKILKTYIDKKGYGIAYGDDTIQGERVPTSAMISTNIIKSLGWMALPTSKHLYIDNTWKIIGQALEALYYDPEVVWEHHHFLNQKAEVDESYKFSNSEERYKEDGEAFKVWLETKATEQLTKLRQELVTA